MVLQLSVTQPLPLLNSSGRQGQFLIWHNLQSKVGWRLCTEASPFLHMHAHNPEARTHHGRCDHRQQACVPFPLPVCSSKRSPISTLQDVNTLLLMFQVLGWRGEAMG